MTDNKGDYKALRREYQAKALNRSDLAPDPVAQFGLWLEDARAAMPDDATSMTLATAAADGMPSVRIVLLKHFDVDGFCWYTDYRSRKGQELAANPRAEIMFYWPALERQVRIGGTVEPLAAEFGDTYFNERPLGSRLSAAASCQSAVIDSRASLEARVEELRRLHADGKVPKPELWGGYRLKPLRFEFWQGRESRLHDRFSYRLENGDWTIERLQP
ncbi:pyridoxine/pyridoxamine 5'-phosphate oxidase [Marinobacterium nitratireducens]|uniref:Pyridoxine/pyridoxamine 5'-phosphate oxidase n=1 Tax=Marinobacterium nitratireducens TaxID=518897 RepID=A0A918DX79_9GAMM|nr:pyridoxamine 5'-phosphate oxidase [Marinobacterium nitratireducens]GGO86851.1 pyridoxine/pyridoxamine 5'-phosphate oxidase [Marinobacterium nitratireducens]